MNGVAVSSLLRRVLPALFAVLALAALPAVVHAQRVTNPVPNPLVCNPTATMYSHPIIGLDGTSAANIRVSYFQIDGGNVSDFRIVSENFTSSAGQRYATISFNRTAPGARQATLTIKGMRDISFKGVILSRNVPFTETVTLKDK